MPKLLSSKYFRTFFLLAVGVGLGSLYMIKQGESMGGDTVLLSPQEFRSAISQNVVILDLRTDEEYQSGHIEGATQIDYYRSDFQNEIARLDRGKTYLIYCRSGNRSSQAAGLMRHLGFSDVRDLKGGMSAWIGAGYPISR